MAPKFPYTAPGFIGFYNFMLADRRITMPPHLRPVCEGALDKRIDKLLVTIGPGSGKSMCLSTMLPAFEIGHDPTITQLGISAGEGLIQGFQRGVMEFIADSKRWKAAFPDVTPDKLAGWSLERGLFVKGHLPGDPDPNYAAFGVDSKKLTGVHARRITLDDIHDKDNGKTSEQCMAVRRTYYNTILGRADPQGCRFIAAGRRWHPDDLYGHFAASGEWVHMNLPAVREGKDLYWDITMPKGFDCCFSNY
jgi:hypothetical protein